MNRRNWLYAFSGLFATPLLSGVIGNAPREAVSAQQGRRTNGRKLLAADAYQVLFEDGTERAGSSALNNEKRPGTYHLRGLQPAPVRCRTQVRKRHRLAQLLAGRCRARWGPRPTSS
jgi:hypothetical protein